MAHYAKVVNGVVTNVVVADTDWLQTFVDTEPGEWVQTSYNTRGGVHYGPDGEPDGGTPLRKNYAGYGYIYDRQRDAFIPPKPYPSWVLDEQTCWWEAPVPKPIEGEKVYIWDEDTVSWVEKPEPIN